MLLYCARRSSLNLCYHPEKLKKGSKLMTEDVQRILIYMKDGQGMDDQEERMKNKKSQNVSI